MTKRPSPPAFAPGDTPLLAVHALAHGGRAVCRAEGFVIFVDRGLPGQTVRARIDTVKKRFAEATALEVVTPSGREVAPPCPHFGECGGCLWQDMAYQEQLDWKRTFVADSLKRLAGAGDVAVAATLPSPRTLGCRNKMEFAFGGEAVLDLGLRRRGSHGVVNVRCPLMSGRVADMVDAVRAACRASGLPAWSPATRSGCWRHLVVRASLRTGDLMLLCITAPGAAHAAAARAVGEAVCAAAGEAVTFVHAERGHPAQLAFGERTVWTLGSGLVRERLDDLTYAISPNAFFQTNTDAAEVLYQVVRDATGLAAPAAPGAPVAPGTACPEVWDLYCGSGGITLFLARHLPPGGRIVGMESNAVAVADAQANADANGLACAFRTGDVRRLVQREPTRPDVVVTDPPRAGMHPDVTAALRAAGPRRIVYVSCDPATQARDLAALLPAYAIRRVQPVDLFPHNPHVESVVLLERAAHGMPE